MVSRWFAGQSQIFHFLYGENSFRFIGGLKRLPKRNYLIATYHTPPARFEQVVRNRAHLSSLDAIITMSSSQREYFTQYLDPDRVFFVPHGVDTETYRPETESKFTDAMLHCIFVGSHLRDFETLKRVIELVAKADDKIKFCIVTDDRYHGKFTDLKGVDLLSRVSDKHLLELYQASDLLLLPVTEATANNSLLEAMACGLPILATDLPGIRDYIDPACSVLTKMRDAEAMAKEILTLKADPERRMLMARASRVQAERLSWPRIAEQVQGVYRSLV